MLQIANKFISKIENVSASLSQILITFTALVTIRVLIENWLNHFKSFSGEYLFYEWSHLFLSLGLTFLLFLLFFHWTFKISLFKLLNVLSLGFLIIWTPPLTDYLVSHFLLNGQKIWSYYELGSLSQLKNDFLTFFSRDYAQGTTYGVCLEIALAIIFLSIYVGLKQGFLKALLAFLISYFIFFILGTLPSWPAILVLGWPSHFLQVTEIDVAKFFLTPAQLFSFPIKNLITSLSFKMNLWLSVVDFILLIILLYQIEKKKFFAWLKNGRWPQIIYHEGLFLLGIALALIFNTVNWWWDFFNFFALLVAMQAILLAWWASVTINDIFDKKIDSISNSRRPYIKNIFSKNNLIALFWFFFFFSSFLGALLSWKILGLLLAYQSLAWLYSASPLRLKRIPIVASFISALASLLILFIGYILVSPYQNLENLPSELIILLLVSYTLSLPLKDLKDIKGDKQDKIWTIPVIFGDYWGRIIIASGIFFSFILSVIVLNEYSLLWWAILAGSLSFWVINNKKINPRWLSGYILVIIILYGLIIVKTISHLF